MELAGGKYSLKSSFSYLSSCFGDEYRDIGSGSGGEEEDGSGFFSSAWEHESLYMFDRGHGSQAVQLAMQAGA